jgi:hypothetical protein
MGGGFGFDHSILGATTMTAPEQTRPRPVRRPAPGLHDLLSLDLPRSESFATPDGQAVRYRLDCGAAELARPKSAAKNAADLLEAGIEAVGEPLGHVGRNSPEGFDPDNLSYAGWLLAELAKRRREIGAIEHVLERAEPNGGAGQG